MSECGHRGTEPQSWTRRTPPLPPQRGCRVGDPGLRRRGSRRRTGNASVRSRARLCFRPPSWDAGRPAMPADVRRVSICSVRSDLRDSVSPWPTAGADDSVSAKTGF